MITCINRSKLILPDINIQRDIHLMIHNINSFHFRESGKQKTLLLLPLSEQSELNNCTILLALMVQYLNVSRLFSRVM